VGGNANRILLGKSIGNLPVGRLRSRGRGSIKKELREVVSEDGRWMKPAQDRVQ
jgi:hypothetical protein